MPLAIFHCQTSLLLDLTKYEQGVLKGLCYSMPKAQIAKLQKLKDGKNCKNVKIAKTGGILCVSPFNPILNCSELICVERRVVELKQIFMH